MKKSSFLQGALIATLGIIISKILGVIYVIPFYAIIGEQGGALYGYAYNIYSIFLGVASVGLPLAISKLVSEYNALGYYYAKERVYTLGRKVITTLGIIVFLTLIIFAPHIAYLIIGDIKGGNTIEDVSYVVRMVSFAILVVPGLSIARGYLQGHKYITPTAFSQVIEQIVRVTFIIFGSYLTLRVFNLKLSNAVGIAVFGAFIGALFSYGYLIKKIFDHSNKLNRHAEITRAETKLTDNKIIKRLLMYAIPFIIIDISKNIYNSVDMVTLVKTLVNSLNYNIKVAESVMSIISTWGHKLNMIVASIATGIIVSLIPNLVSSFVIKDIDDVRKKINQALQILIYITIPMTVGLSFLAKPVWTAFYGTNVWGPVVFKYSIFMTLFSTIFNTTIIILQSVNRYKMVFTCLVLGLLTKIFLNIPLMYSFEEMGMYAFYGAITATILGYLVGVITGLIYLNKIFNINYEKTIKHLINIVFVNIIMVLVLSLLKIIIPLSTSNRLLSLLICFVYAIGGATIYFVITYYNKTFEQIFGKRLKNLIVEKWATIANKKML